ncbi:MAG: cytochrome c [Flavobacterium sp.]|uniref:c-type cytochrome n=1 Tax=Flavobacterium sp. TaxID=239 RepID=UPI0022CB49B4|nr:cytochrome c [Flavobacterium sp.]MCZ8197177.1 cytochrome c [Flavobacterium sp.]
MKNIFLFFVLFTSIIASNKSFAQVNDWIAPESANSLNNPFLNNQKATEVGKAIFNEMCVLCHGLYGKGNGEAGLTLEKKPANFLSLEVANETDGAIFWKVTNGKAPMAGYSELLSDEQRWQLVNYIRELGKNGNENAVKKTPKKPNRR